MSIQYVVARYNEDIKWLDDYSRDIIIYNKGSPLGIVNERPLPNVGREAHTYLHHIVQNYDNLPDITVFTQARISDHFGVQDISTFDSFLDDCCECGHSTTYKEYRNHPAFKPDFNITLAQVLFKENAVPIEQSLKMTFGVWFTKFIDPEYPTDGVCIYIAAIFAVDRRHIHSRPKSYYERLLNECSKHNSPIEAHFLERSWYYIFNCGKL